MVQITKIVQPEIGWPLAMHCKHCQKTVLVLSPWAAKPEDGDYWLMEICIDNCKASRAEMLTPARIRFEESNPRRQIAYRPVQEES